MTATTATKNGRRAAPAPDVPPAAAWPADKVERRLTASLAAYARNARTHSPEQVTQIAASITEFGFTIPVLVDEEDVLIAGHGRVLAALELGLAEVPAMVARGWSEAQIKAYRIVDNQLALTAAWDNALLRMEVSDLSGLGFDLNLLGFGDDVLAELMAPATEPPPDDTGGGSSNLLGLTEIAIGPPRTIVEPGETWALGHHLLHCGCPHEDWKVWSHFLNQPSDLFLPYPGIWVPLGEKGKERRFIMVQPSPFIAGHMIDRYMEINGEDSVVRHI